MKTKSIISLICLLLMLNIAKTQCLAGNVPPILLSYSLSSTCPENTVSLNTVIDPTATPIQCDLIWLKMKHIQANLL